MHEFMIFVAPFIMVILSILIASVLAPMDKVVWEEHRKSEKDLS